MMSPDDVVLPEGLFGFWELLGTIEELMTGFIADESLDLNAAGLGLAPFDDDEIPRVRKSLQIIMLAAVDIRTLLEEILLHDAPLRTGRLLRWVDTPGDLDVETAETTAATDSAVFLRGVPHQDDEEGHREARRYVRWILRLIATYTAVVEIPVEASITRILDQLQTMDLTGCRRLHSAADLALLTCETLRNAANERAAPKPTDPA